MRSKWDKNVIKPKDKFKRKHFQYNSNKCSRCKRFKHSRHHYLCQPCWELKNKEWLKNNGVN